MPRRSWIAAVTLPLVAAPVLAADTTVTMQVISAQGTGAAIGTVRFSDTPAGLKVVTRLHSLAPGPHGFHVHENPDCGVKLQDGKPVAGLAAGGHFDPTGAKAHAGPHAQGHLGDLPLLEVAADGRAERTLTAPRLKVADLKGRTIIVHEGGDNYSDQPKPLGGGGARVACAVVR
jgi:Cu-Zn family superoxide dismutase